MKDENWIGFRDGDEAIHKGYAPCHRCLPPEGTRGASAEVQGLTPD